MKLHAQRPAGSNTITAYAADQVSINGQPFYTSIIVTAQTLISPWSVSGIEALTEADTQQLAALGCPIILLGTGQRQRFPAASLLRPLIAANIGVEVMDSGAACRTFNILIAEGRPVAAAILLDARS
jgi:uncharacterized protein